ncbi:DUF5004 domain-containing protein [Bacteroides sp.]|uniref:DUF5004 domain-containing protein n=1 Tax=Bacteroides sp. TaxID=29523 RepID=UPI002621684E|nr:DUF5004 domain-containing protein [Bacteroides sp.]MDD3036614.1 DUF5004 domain-containing protein [Bacteroides sp.]
MRLKTQITALLFVLLGLVTACNTFKDEITPDSYTEVPKQLDGKWQLKTVSRNGTDITEVMDFSQFRLTMNKDNTYTIENYLPFLVKKNGTWKTDDITYPFFLTFQEEGSTREARTEITYPIVKGKRHITLTISPGCSSNSYIYSFEKVEE